MTSHQPLRVYLVGGAVRDRLLDQPSGDRDWVVVGASAAEMVARGFRPVGRDFPVFLHPHTGEEYALARTERKTGQGYHGFYVHADPAVTLEDDLRRRDFTINAIAYDETTGRYIDPYGGIADVHARILRHVSPAFIEDPLRVLRAARLLARFAPIGFGLAPETLALMRQVVQQGELEVLAVERIWQELRRALASPQPSAFLRTLHATGALARVLPELEHLYGIPQRAAYHPEIDTGLHQELVSDMAAQLAPGDALIGFAALTHDLGKALTPRAEWPSHRRHEQRGLIPIAQLCRRLKVPQEYRQLAQLVCQEHLTIHRLEQLQSKTILALLKRCDGFRRPHRVAQLALVCEADQRGRQGFSQTAYPQRTLLCHLHQAAQAIQARAFAQTGLTGIQLGEALDQARLQAIQRARAAWSVETPSDEHNHT